VDQPDLFAAAAPAPALTAWAPDQWPVAPDWAPTTGAFFASDTGRALGQAVGARLAAGATVFPPEPLRALALTPLDRVRVVVLGQDPYHGPGQAEGLAFSVAPGTPLPPSLRNIYKELTRENGQPLPRDGSLVFWAQQGVLLLNTCLTVEQGAAASHAGLGWEALTDAIIDRVNDHPRPKVFLLWGAHAQAKAVRIDTTRHQVLRANHPSPLSALRPPLPFIGCGHFNQANHFLQAAGERPVAWLPESSKTVA
jgi:uracil-DNA glycosylase